MALLLRSNAVFLHIPKTGGVWVESVLQDLGLVRADLGNRHMTAAQVQYGPALENTRLAGLLRFGRGAAKRWWLERIEKYDLAACPKFCFVRHPVTWYESRFKYDFQRQSGHPGRQRFGFWGPGDPRNFAAACSMLNDLVSDEFNQFIQNVLECRPGFLNELFGWYTSWDHQPTRTIVGKQESLTDDLISVLHRLDIEFDETRARTVTPKNVTRSATPIRIEWDPTLKKRLLAAERPLLDRYRYDDDSPAKVESVPLSASENVTK